MALIKVTTPIVPTVDKDLGLANKHRGYYSLNNIDPQSAPLTIYDNGNPVAQYVTYDDGLPVLTNGTVYHPQIDITGPVTFALYYDTGSGLDLKWLDPDYIPGEVALKEDISIEYDFIADIVADANLIIGQNVKWNDYRIDLDGGGNYGIVVAGGTGTDDGGRYFDMASGLQVKAYFNNNEKIDLKKYGLFADDSTDDYALFQNAVDNSPEYTGFTIDDNVTIILTDRVLFKSGQSFDSGCKIKVTTTNAGLGAIGTRDSEIDLSVAITTQGERDITTLSVHGLLSGDFAFLKSSINCLSVDALDWQLGEPTPTGAKSFFAEWVEVSKQVSSTKITIFNGTVFKDYPLIPGPNSGARTISTLAKINPIVNVKLKNFTIIHDFIGTADKIRFELCAFCEIHNVTIQHGDQVGRAVEFNQCYECKAYDLTAYHNMEDFDYLGNGTGYAYFQFNDYITESSQNILWESCQSHNGTQCFDVTYDASGPVLTNPSIGTTINNWLTFNCQNNPVTTHSGSFLNTISNGRAINSARGLLSRCRGDMINNNYIHCVVGEQVKYPGDNKYGIILSDGFTVGATVSNNTVVNAGLAIRWTKKPTGFNVMDATINDNILIDCLRGIVITKEITDANHINTEASNLCIKNNNYFGLVEQHLRLAEYTNNVAISGEIIHSGQVAGAQSEMMSIQENCQNVLIADCKYMVGAGASFPLIRAQSLLDVVTYPPGTVHELNIYNIFDGGSDDTIRYDGLDVGKEYGPTVPTNYFSTTVAGSAILDMSTGTFINLSSAATITTINGLRDGEMKYIKKNSNGLLIDFDELDNIRITGASTLTLTTSEEVVFAIRHSGNVFIGIMYN